MKGQITISTLTGTIILIAAIGAPFLYVSNIKADGASADAKLSERVIVNTTNIQNLEKKIDEVNQNVKDIKDYLNIKG